MMDTTRLETIGCWQSVSFTERSVEKHVF